ncbi:MAG TPA: VCBS repeat-containing protein, partial [Segetibacter sp.]|nr:VCBS repeat-containing protein [Segetibacter sp.]
NQGPRVNQKDSVGDPVFSDIGFFSGVAETDWSWTPLVQDFDNDGNRDIIITNGFPKDITDHDFVSFRQHSYSIASKQFTLEQIPQVKLHNYAFKNNGNLTFENTTQAWGITTPSFSNGAAYADLDNDGDLDMIINNINDEAFVYENTLAAGKDTPQHYLNLILMGDSLNRNGLGTWIEIYYGGKQQAYEQTPYRGYLSTIDMRPHFGLGAATKVDSVLIKWPGNKKQVLQNVNANQTLTVNITQANETYSWSQPVYAPNTLFTEITDSLGVHYQHEQKDFVDFNIQKLLPHKFSEYGPALAVGDIDGNGLDDIIAGGAISYSPVALLQKSNGSFSEKSIFPDANYSTKQSDDRGVTLFDAEGDGDLDLYIASGGYETKPNSGRYRNIFFVNNGKGNFSNDSAALPENLTSKSCVRVTDYDNDGDLDLFVAGRVEPGNYPKPVSSFIYRNDTKDGVIKFTDVTASIAKPLQNIGMVCDAVWTDFDNDGSQDLILAGEWMPVTFLKNNKGNFENITPSTNIADKKGWWTSILPADFDNDGDIDYIVGNLGLNSFFKANDQYPATIYAKDFDNNGSFDAIPTLYLPTSQEDTTRREYPVHTRD